MEMRDNIKSWSNLAYTVQKIQITFSTLQYWRRDKNMWGGILAPSFPSNQIQAVMMHVRNLQNFLPKDPDAKGLGNIVCSIGPTILLEKWKEPIEN